MAVKSKKSRRKSADLSSVILVVFLSPFIIIGSWLTSCGKSSDEEVTEAISSTTQKQAVITSLTTTTEQIISTTEPKLFTEQEVMIMQFEELGLTENEAKEVQEIFFNVGITKISDIEVRLQTSNGVDGEVQYRCNLNHFDRKTQEIGLIFVIMRRKVQRIDICQFSHGNTFEFYKSLTMLDGIEKGDSVVLYYKKLKGYLQVDENSFGYRAIYDSATHSIKKYE